MGCPLPPVHPNQESQPTKCSDTYDVLFITPRYKLKLISLCFVHVCAQLLNCVRLFATPWTVAYQAPPSMGFLRQEYGSGLPFPSPGDLPDPGIEQASPALAGGLFTSKPTGKPLLCTLTYKLLRSYLKVSDILNIL